MKRFIPFFIAIFTALTACTEYHDFERRLATADSLMNHEQPDSAYRMLCAMNEEAERLPKAQRMRHLLLRSNAQNKADVLFVSDSIGTLLVDYYDQHGTPNERMLAHYMKGCAYRDMQDQPAALHCYNDAVAAADTSSADCDFYQLLIIQFQLAQIFNERTMPDNAIHAYDLAEKYARKINDTIALPTIWNNKSIALINKGASAEGVRLREMAANRFQSMGNHNRAARIRELCVKWYTQQDSLDKAKATMEEYEAHSGYFLKDGDIEDGREMYYHTKGNYFLKKGELDSAKLFFYKLLQQSTTRNNQYLATCGLAQVFYKQNRQDSVAKYALQALTHSDTLYNSMLFNIETAQNLQNNQVLYNYARHKENVLRKELETKDTQLRLYNWIAGSIITATLLTLLILFLRRQIGQKHKELALANQKNSQLHTKIQENSEIIKGLNEQITEKSHLIEELNRIINKNTADMQLNTQLQHTVNLLQQQVDAYKREIDIHAQKYNQHSLLQHPTAKRFYEMGKARKATPSYDDWHALYPLVEEYCPNLAAFRKDTSDTEYQICILTKLGLRASDIAHLTHNSSNNITNMRSRMLTKLFGMEGGAKDFDIQIKSL